MTAESWCQEHSMPGPQLVKGKYHSWDVEGQFHARGLGQIPYWYVRYTRTVTTRTYHAVSLNMRCTHDLTVLSCIICPLQVPPYTRTDSVIISHTITGSAQSSKHLHQKQQQQGNTSCCVGSSSTAAVTHPDVKPEQHEGHHSIDNSSAPDSSESSAQATPADPIRPQASPTQDNTAKPSNQPHTTLPSISFPAIATLPANTHPSASSLPAAAPLTTLPHPSPHPLSPPTPPGV